MNPFPCHGFVRWAVVTAVLVSLVVSAAPTGAEEPTTAPEVGVQPWRQMSAGDSHTCAIRPSRHLYCWGSDSFGQLGDGGPNDDMGTPVEVFGGGANWSYVSTGGGHTCALKTTGRLYCWGSDQAGAVGDGAPEVHQAIPVEVAGGATNWTDVQAGGASTCGLRSTGRLFCWGRGTQVGNGGTVDQPVPVPVAGAARNWTSVSVGATVTCGRRATGRLYCWGADGQGQLGDGGPNQDRRAPVLVALGFTDWASVSADGGTTCGIRASGLLYCWGSDGFGALGNGGGNVERHTPARVAGRDARWGAVSVGGYFVCARRTTGRLYCWGTDADGNLGDGGADLRRRVPSEVAGNGTNWALPSAGYRHACALRTTGRLFCWGGDDVGQLGNGGTNLQRSSPSVVP